MPAKISNGIEDAVARHFNAIARDYDFWKKKNYFYQKNLRELLQALVPADAMILDIGCGTGDMLASLKPSFGLGIDISERMIERANQKYAGRARISFATENLLSRTAPFENFDVVIMIDVLEHLADPAKFLGKISFLAPKHAKIIVSVANPLWEPILWAAEKLGQKMPEGPHERMSLAATESIFRQSGFRIAKKGYRMLIPRNIWGADWVNKNFYKIRILVPLGFIAYWVLERDERR